MALATIIIIGVSVLIAWYIYSLAYRFTRFLFGGGTKRARSSNDEKMHLDKQDISTIEPKIRPPENPIKSIHIAYKSSSGQITNRTVDIVDNRRRGYIEAYCHLRSDYRTFNLASVLSSIDITTGEEIENLNEFLGFAPSFEQEYSLTDKFISRHKDELAILLFVGKADGRLMRPERLLIAAYLETQSGETDDKLIDNTISYADVPSVAGYKRAVGRVAKENVHVLSHLYDTSKKIVATQKRVAPSEQEALDYIKSRLSVPA